MNEQAPNPWEAAETEQPMRKKRARWPWIAGIIGAFAIGVAAGAAGGASKVEPAAAPAPVTVTQPPETVTGPPETVTQPAQTVTETVTVEPPEPVQSGPATSFSDGTYLVGTDIEAGSYKSSGPSPGGIGKCYWARLSDDSGTDIIANDLTSGATRVTVNDGEYLEVNGCEFSKG